MKFHDIKQPTSELEIFDRNLSIAIACVASLVLGLAVATYGPRWTRATHIEPVLLGEVGLWSPVIRQ